MFSYYLTTVVTGLTCLVGYHGGCHGLVVADQTRHITIML